MEKFNLSGKNVLITGSSSGLGRGIALGLAKAGADIILVARRKERLEEVASEIRNCGSKSWIFDFDLSQTDKISELYANILTEVNVIDVLINVAGINFRESAVDFPVEEWQKVIHMNLTVPFITAQNFARHCISQKKSGKIINITSLLSESTRPMIPAYTASKGGLKQLTKALAVEWAPHKINVNAIGPGYFRTEMTQPLAEQPEFMSWVLESTPLGRWGIPEDLVGAAVFLSSAASAYITGQTIYVDGGWLSNL